MNYNKITSYNVNKLKFVIHIIIVKQETTDGSRYICCSYNLFFIV